MNRIILAAIILLYGCLAIHAEEIKTLCTYAFHNCTVLDRDFNVMDKQQSTNGDPLGLFNISESEGKKYILVTLGEDPVYEIQVVNVVEGKPEGGSRIDMYQGGMKFQGQVVVINVFLEYDTSRRTSDPDAVTIDVYNSPNFIQLNGLVKVGKQM